MAPSGRTALPLRHPLRRLEWLTLSLIPFRLFSSLVYCVSRKQVRYIKLRVFLAHKSSSPSSPASSPSYTPHAGRSSIPLCPPALLASRDCVAVSWRAHGRERLHSTQLYRGKHVGRYILTDTSDEVSLLPVHEGAPVSTRRGCYVIERVSSVAGQRKSGPEVLPGSTATGALTGLSAGNGRSTQEMYHRTKAPQPPSPSWQVLQCLAIEQSAQIPSKDGGTENNCRD